MEIPVRNPLPRGSFPRINPGITARVSHCAPSARKARYAGPVDQTAGGVVVLAHLPHFFI